MNTAWANDLNKLFENGVKATWCGICFADCVDVTWAQLNKDFLVLQVAGATFYFSVIGLKGDWPYVRKVGMVMHDLRNYWTAHGRP